MFDEMIKKRAKKELLDKGVVSYTEPKKKKDYAREWLIKHGYGKEQK